MGILVLILLLIATLLGIFRDRFKKKEYHTIIDTFFKKIHLSRIDAALIFTCLVCTGFQILDLKRQNTKDREIRNEYNLNVKNQLKLTEYMQELNHEVRAIYFRVKLKKEYLFEEICPLKFGFEFNPGGDSPLKFRKLITNAELWNSVGYKKVLNIGYIISDVSFKDTATITTTYTLGRRISRIQNIDIPVEFGENITDAVKEFHDESFYAYFQSSLIDKIDSIQLVINGWAILDESPKNVFWREDPRKWLSLKSKDMGLVRPITDPKGENPPSYLWRLNVYNKIPVYNKKAAARVMPPSLTKGRVLQIY